MNGQHHGGKGSAQRPVAQAKFDLNWDAIFNSDPSDKELEADLALLEYLDVKYLEELGKCKNT